MGLESDCSLALNQTYSSHLVFSPLTVINKAKQFNLLLTTAVTVTERDLTLDQKGSAFSHSKRDGSSHWVASGLKQNFKKQFI